MSGTGYTVQMLPGEGEFHRAKTHWYFRVWESLTEKELADRLKLQIGPNFFMDRMLFHNHKRSSEFVGYIIKHTEDQCQFAINMAYPDHLKLALNFAEPFCPFE